jgi:hypothetical protein
MAVSCKKFSECLAAHSCERAHWQAVAEDCILIETL